MNRTVRFFVAACSLVVASSARAAFECPLIEGKEGGGRIPLVFYAVGYTQAERAKYESDVARTLKAIFEEEPFRLYRNRFNVRRAWTPSLRSGLAGSPDDSTFGRIWVSDHMPQWEWSGFLHFMDADTGFHCEGLDQEYTTRTPGVLLANAGQMGGVVWLQRWAVVPRENPGVTLHELGHVLGDLSEEYSLSDPSPFFGSWDAGGHPYHPIRNTWKDLNRDSIPWKTWLTESVPLPTPPIAAYADTAGVFEGGDGWASGRYRPFLSCRMRNANTTFCPVCKEALAYRILTWRSRWVARGVAIDSVAPLPSETNSWGKQSVVSQGKVFVHRIQGDSLPASLRWRLAGVWLSDTGMSVDVGSLPQDGLLEAILSQESPFIRNPDLIPRDTLRWTVRKAAAVLGRTDGEVKIRRMGQAMFHVPTGIAVPSSARDGAGRKVVLEVVARTARGMLVRGASGSGGVLFLDPADAKTKSVGEPR